MITPFSRYAQNSVVPSNRSLIVISIVLTILMLFYLMTFGLYFALLFPHEEAIQHKILTAISVLELLVTISSIVISIVATRISDLFSDACIKRIEYFNKQNRPFHDGIKLDDAENKVKSNFKNAKHIKTIVIIVFAVYLISSIIWYLYNRVALIQLLTFVLGAVSAIFSIILALASVISCVEAGKYTDLLLNALYEDNKRLIDICNNHSISRKNENKFESGIT